MGAISRTASVNWLSARGFTGNVCRNEQDGGRILSRSLAFPRHTVCMLLGGTVEENGLLSGRSPFGKGVSLLQIVIPVTGSRGDVQPYIALGSGLRAAGHQVRVATHADFADTVRQQGLEFFPLAPDARAFHETRVGRRMLTAGSNPF